jgi:steroid delta-isomerase
MERHRRRFNAGDRAGWLANFVDEPYLEEPVGTPRRLGRDAFAAVFDAYWAAGGGPGIPPFDVTVVGGREIAIYLEGAPRDDGADRAIIEIFEIADDGRIAGSRVFIDPRRLPPT